VDMDTLDRRTRPRRGSSSAPFSVARCVSDFFLWINLLCYFAREC
jgi:hypothetical protein